jgi:hypothetical protein
MSSASNNGGNIRYLAPERVDPASQDMRRTTACDVYGFACVCLFVSPLPVNIHEDMALMKSLAVYWTPSVSRVPHAFHSDLQRRER